MKSTLVSSLGLAFGLFGLALLSDTLLVHRAMAIPAEEPCDCSRPASSPKKCIGEETWSECPGQPQGTCLEEDGSITVYQSPFIQFVDTGNVPDGCVNTTDKVNCGNETIQCFKKTFCKWDAGTATCSVDPAGQGLVRSASKRIRVNCAAGLKCPPRQE